MKISDFGSMTFGNRSSVACSQADVLKISFLLLIIFIYNQEGPPGPPPPRIQVPFPHLLKKKITSIRQLRHSFILRGLVCAIGHSWVFHLLIFVARYIERIFIFIILLNLLIGRGRSLS